MRSIAVIHRCSAALALVGWVLASGCGGHHVQLLYGGVHNDTGASYLECTPADPDARPEHRQLACSKLNVVPQEALGNTGTTVRFDVPECEVGKPEWITIVNAGSDSAKLYLRCGQATTLGDGHGL